MALPMLRNCILLTCVFLNCLAVKLELVANPDVVKSSVTKQLQVNCTFTFSEDDDVKKMYTIAISRGKGEMVASLSAFNPARPLTDQESLSVAGEIITAAKNTIGYLNLTWPNPGQRQAGTYVCTVNALNFAWDGITFRTNLTVPLVEPTDRELFEFKTSQLEDMAREFRASRDENMKRISQTEEVIRQMTLRLYQGEAKVKALEERLNETLVKISDLEKTLEGLNSSQIVTSLPRVEGGIVECGDSKTYYNFRDSQNHRRVVKQVTFTSQYKAIPTVFLSVYQLDVTSNQSLNKTLNPNVKFYFYPSNISLTGFDLVCGTWDNSSIYSMNVNWVAILF
ncbi:uncharacterized protein LOC131939613 [Physella acuta]|uniref:uncharacterized protein LOC131939613 n=1 Tax=Physella acuta TaxID=109671 RepID=UPI0027DD9372|nr:uncharacterized protein LOC131939613 [Physella acuta]